MWRRLQRVLRPAVTGVSVEGDFVRRPKISGVLILLGAPAWRWGRWLCIHVLGPEAATNNERGSRAKWRLLRTCKRHVVMANACSHGFCRVFGGVIVKGFKRLGRERETGRWELVHLGKVMQDRAVGRE